MELNFGLVVEQLWEQTTNNNIGGATNMYMYLDNGTKTTESFAFSKRFKLKANTKYTLSGWFHNFTKCPSFDVFLLSSTSVAQSDTGTSYTNAQTLISSQNTSGSWKKFSVTFTTPASVISGYIRLITMDIILQELTVIEFIGVL